MIPLSPQEPLGCHTDMTKVADSRKLNHADLKPNINQASSVTKQYPFQCKNHISKQGCVEVNKAFAHWETSTSKQEMSEHPSELLLE